MLAVASNATAGTALNSVTVGPQSPVQVNPGTEATYVVTVTRTGSGDIDVYLTSAGLPVGATASFSPGMVHFTGPSPLSQTAILTVSTSTALPPGVYPFAVIGRDGGSHNTASAGATLTVGNGTPPQSVPPIITSIKPFGDPVIVISAKGTPSHTYLLEATFNLNPPVWSTIATNVADTNGLLSYIDSDATNYPCRFYRVALVGLSKNFLLGDVNGDGILSMADFTLAMKLAVGQRSPTPTELAAGDLNGNGVIDKDDAHVILRMIKANHPTPN